MYIRLGRAYHTIKCQWQMQQVPSQFFFFKENNTWHLCGLAPKPYFSLKILEMCQYDTDSPVQEPSSPWNKHFAKNEVEKGPYTHDNWPILSERELGLYFMIIYLCIKYESNTQMFSKDMEWKPFFVHTDEMMKVKNGHNLHSTLLISPLIELDLYFMIKYLCKKYESNTVYTNLFKR